ncbi:two-component system, NarL family, response regulator DegU [Salinibacillus kushneri]|uniref:Two-component system, NarL family, response regulator DegU n=1 Tax=Salinibacillus kushneri TaxID=237682 RepID=A0A1I0EPY9_9BACI|nr:response regulator transcription factor [Salinibacillus kushneri]SET47556.1 two-component system, NarL family, response regulator DegU [Salinibacillus kushneri]
MKIALIKKPSLLRDLLLNELKNLFSNYEFKAYSSKEFNRLFQEQEHLDFLIIDLDTDIDFYSLIDSYKKSNKKIAVWASTLDNTDLFDLFKLDLNGYFFNGMEKEELAFAIQSIVKGKRYVHHELTRILMNDYARVHHHSKERPVGVFSKREWDVLELLTKGYKNQDIAEFLFITEKTVKQYVSSILRKLEVEDRTNAVITALKNKWFVL